MEAGAAKPLIILAREADGTVCGGLLGETVLGTVRGRKTMVKEAQDNHHDSPTMIGTYNTVTLLSRTLPKSF